MTSPHQRPAVSLLHTSSHPTLSYRLALAVSYTVSPLVLPPVFFGLALTHLGASAVEVGRGVAIGIVFFGVVPLGYVLWMVQTGRALSVDLRDRTRRTGPFLVGIGSYILGLLVVLGLGGTGASLLAAVISCHLVNTLGLTLVTLRWKISIHAAAVAGFVAMLAFVVATPLPGATDFLSHLSVALCVPLVPVVAWARIRAGVHTRAQVLAGTLVGLVLPYAELWALWQLGALGG